MTQYIVTTNNETSATDYPWDQAWESRKDLCDNCPLRDICAAAYILDIPCPDQER